VLLPEAEEMLDQLCRVKTGMHAIHWIDRFCEVAKVWPAFPKSGLVKIATLEASGLLTIRFTKLSFNGGTFPWTIGKRNIYIYVRRCRKLGVHRFRNLESMLETGFAGRPNADKSRSMLGLDSHLILK